MASLPRLAFACHYRKRRGPTIVVGRVASEAGERRQHLTREEGQSVAHVDDIQITAKPDQTLVPLPEGASYLGFIFARDETPQRVEQALRLAHARLAFRIEPAINLVAVG